MLDLPITPTALYTLAAPSTSDEVRQAALEEAGKGNTVTPEQISYYRGLQYEREKVKVTNKTGRNQHVKVGAKSLPQPKTSEKLASQHKVSQQTIKNDAQFARAVDNVAKAAGNRPLSSIGTESYALGQNPCTEGILG